MRAAGEQALLSLWENGQIRHPLDRTLLLYAWARPDIAADRVAQSPLGAINADLLKMRRTLFGPRVDATVVCDRCGELLELRLEIAQLLERARAMECREVNVDGFRFRLPDSCDLAAVAAERDVDAAAEKLFERCCLARPDETTPLSAVRESIEAAMEAADPLADLRLDVVCDACGHRWTTVLDPAVILWDELRDHARTLLAQVHALAQAYGWTEAEVLALSPQRRAAYLGMVGA
jgi:hypothetical protein